MAEQTKQSTTEQQAPPPKKDRAAEIANTFEWLITAFILAFVFRAFVMEAFRIPTGSMADTLMGAHFRVGCTQCGNHFPHGFVPGRFRLRQDTIPPTKVKLPTVRCPSCGYIMQDSAQSPLRMSVNNGDRILVLKCLYQFMDPHRWDVIVFKNPTNPAENYIKRLIGLPGEEIEIVDGDIFVDGRIARKPRKVQEELWMPLYHHDHHPIAPKQGSFNRYTWQSPFNFKNSRWFQDPNRPTQLQLRSNSDQRQSLIYGANSANDSRASYAYNQIEAFGLRPYASDLMIDYFAQTTDTEASGEIGAAVQKYGVTYAGSITPEGLMVITQTQGHSEPEVLAQGTTLFHHKPTHVKFAVVDRQVVLQYGDSILKANLAEKRNGLSLDRSAPPQLAILGAGSWTISHVSIFRDIHYTSRGDHNRIGRAVEGYPFQLNEDEFFALGDNSPNSEDGRWWRTPESASRGHEPPRAGVVPRHYLVGKAMFVYWPSGYAFPWPQSIRNLAEGMGNSGGFLRIFRVLVQLRWIPNVGKMRFIYGGTRANSKEVIPNTDT